MEPIRRRYAAIEADEGISTGIPHLVEIVFEQENVDPNDTAAVVRLLFDRAAQHFPNDGVVQLLAGDAVHESFSRVSRNVCRTLLAQLLHRSLAYSSELVPQEEAMTYANQLIDLAMANQDPADSGQPLEGDEDYDDEKKQLPAATGESIWTSLWNLVFGLEGGESQMKAVADDSPIPKKQVNRSVRFFSSFRTYPNGQSSWASISNCTFDGAIIIISPRNAILVLMVDED